MNTASHAVRSIFLPENRCADRCWGLEGSERKAARFGEDEGAPERPVPFPVCCISSSLKSEYASAVAAAAAAAAAEADEDRTPLPLPLYECGAP